MSQVKNVLYDRLRPCEREQHERQLAALHEEKREREALARRTLVSSLYSSGYRSATSSLTSRSSTSEKTGSIV